MSIYGDIAKRTGGDIYIGVVGPVRTGKSTFIKRFMDTLVIPNIGNDYERQRAVDELPQSAGGRTVMTTEPKFIPDEAARVTLADNVSFNMRMVDCVGFMVPDALGELEEGKPFVVILNSATPESEASRALALELEERYKAPVALVNCLELDAEDIKNIMELVLLEFPVREISVKLPEWISGLDPEHRIVRGLRESILESAAMITKAGEAASAFASLASNEYIESAQLTGLDLGSGKGSVEIAMDSSLYYTVLEELTGYEIQDEAALFAIMAELAGIKRKYDKLQPALDAVERSGYGIVTPEMEDLSFDEPEIIKAPNGYGIKLRARAPSIHMIRANIETELNPIVGSEEQSRELIRHLLSEFEDDPSRIWGSNIFGKSMHDLVNEGLNAKLENMPDDARAKLSGTLERIVNEGTGGLICILL